MSPTQTLSEVNTKPASESIELRPIQNNALEEVQSPTVVAGEETTEPDYPKGSKFFLIFFALMLTLLLAGLDVNILSTAIPRITDEFHTIADVGWYLTAYRLSSSSLQFAFGKLYKQYSTKWLLVGSIAVFLFGSILCAAAVSSRMFVVGRAVTGVGVAGGSAGFFNILSELVPLRERPLYGSIFGAVEGVSGLAAPPLGEQSEIRAEEAQDRVANIVQVVLSRRSCPGAGASGSTSRSAELRCLQWHSCCHHPNRAQRLRGSDGRRPFNSWTLLEAFSSYRRWLHCSLLLIGRVSNTAGAMAALLVCLWCLACCW